MTNENTPYEHKFIELAQAYAKVRWCFDDESLIEEACLKCLESKDGFSPSEMIDRLASDYEFDDPYGVEGALAPMPTAIKEHLVVLGMDIQAHMRFGQSFKKPKP